MRRRRLRSSPIIRTLSASQGWSLTIVSMEFNDVPFSFDDGEGSRINCRSNLDSAVGRVRIGLLAESGLSPWPSRDSAVCPKQVPSVYPFALIHCRFECKTDRTLFIMFIVCA